MKSSLLLLFSAFICLFPNFNGRLAAQQKESPDPLVMFQPVQEIPPLAMTELISDAGDLSANLRNVKVIHEPGTDLLREKLNAMKAEANRQRATSGRWGNITPGKNQDALISDPPVVGTNFQANIYDGSIPNDNHICISSGGNIVSVTNSRVHCYNSSGTLTDQSSLGGFVSGAPGIGNNSKYDPRALYDPFADRFIVVFLNGSSATTSKIVICFSKTNDPSGLWNIYALNGNITGSVWSDFPAIGISTQELFITTNLFTNAGAFQAGGLFRVELADGYAGTTLTSQSASTPYFSLHPVTGGLTPYGPHFYLIRTENAASSLSVTLHKVSNSMANGGTLLSPVTLQLDNSYSIPPAADQQGSTTQLQTGDNRIHASYFENNRIQYVHNTGFMGRSAVYYGTIQLSALDLNFSLATGMYISYPDIDIAFPGLAYGGIQGADGTNTSFVSFNYASPTQYPGNAACYIDQTGVFSGYRVLKTGSSAVTAASGRWGDYSEVAERPGATGEAWVAGSFATPLDYTITWISQLTTPGPLAREKDELSKVSAVKMFPVPASDIVTLEFEVGEAGDHSLFIYDLTGREIAHPVDEYLRKGTGRATFNANALSPGTYIAVVKNAGGEAARSRFTVTH